MKIIELNNITKNYQRNKVLCNLSYSFKKGYYYILVGENGCGKSTLIKSILGLVKLNSGKIILNTNKISYIPEKISFPEFITVYDFLVNIGLIRGMTQNILEERILKLLCEWKIEAAKNKQMSYLSKGMHQKVLIIQALLRDSELYLFDEPLNGLDSYMKAKFLETISQLKQQKKTVLVITHYPEYYQSNSDIILNLENGKVCEKLSQVSF